MAAILTAIGYGPIESLQDFLSRFEYETNLIDPELENIWVCHKKLNLTKLKTALVNRIHDHPYSYINKDDYLTIMQTQFKPGRILKVIFKRISCCLAHYIVSECLLLYNWGINSFELVIENQDFCKELAGYIGRSKELPRKMQRNPCTGGESAFKGLKTTWDLLEMKRNVFKYGRKVRKKCDFNKPSQIPGENHKRDAIECPNEDLIRETFNKKRILYDWKQRRWPENHALSYGSVERLMESILGVKLAGETDGEHQLLAAASNYACLRKIFGAILKNHKTIVNNDGYGRILKRHLKGFRRVNRRLESIPVGAVSSYIIDILRRVIPIEFFGGNRLKKKFMREITKIVNGSKSENFIFKPFVQMFLEVQYELAWLEEIKGRDDVRRIIVKVLKWLLVDYVLIILRNNFYITDVGSCGYRLHYYRKSDMERAIARWVNSRMRKKTLCFVPGDLEHWDNAERKWIETGRIEITPKICMPVNTEWILPVARVRFLPKSIGSDELRLITNFGFKETRLKRRDVEKKKLFNFFNERIVSRLLLHRRVKEFLQLLVEHYGTGINPVPNNRKLYEAWEKARLLKEMNGELYFVKADINDAFGSIVPSLLGAIIEEKLKVKSHQVMQLRKIKECRIKHGKIECCVRESFSDRPLENRLLLSRSLLVSAKKKLPSYKSKYLKGILDQIIQNQYLKIMGKIYKLTTGVTQGSSGALSPLLSEIYCSEMDRLYFTEFMTCSECILLRGVDDYLLMSSSAEKAGKFYDIVSNGIKDFNITFNGSKLKSNVNQDISSFRYLGLIFDVKDMTVRPDYSKYRGKDLLWTMKLPLSNDRFCSVGLTALKLFAITVGNRCNNSVVCREVVFSACVLQASRILVTSRHLSWNPEDDAFEISNVLGRSARKITNSVTGFNRDMSREEITWLFWKAALFVFQKYSGLFSKLLVIIRYRLFDVERKLPRETLFTCLKRDNTYWRGIIATNCKSPNIFRE